MRAACPLCACRGEMRWKFKHQTQRFHLCCVLCVIISSVTLCSRRCFSEITDHRLYRCNQFSLKRHAEGGLRFNARQLLSLSLQTENSHVGKIVTSGWQPHRSLWQAETPVCQWRRACQCLISSCSHELFRDVALSVSSALWRRHVKFELQWLNLVWELSASSQCPDAMKNQELLVWLTFSSSQPSCFRAPACDCKAFF